MMRSLKERNVWLQAAVVSVLSLSPAVIALPQATPTTSIRLGELGRQLSAQDVADLESVIPGGRKPWLLNAERGQAVLVVQSVQVYLPPDTATATVRRGSMMSLMRRTGEQWTVSPNGGQIGLRGAARQGVAPSPTGTWVQVAIAGRSFDDIKDDDDRNRPFLVHGRFDDATITSIAAFLRGASNLPILVMVRELDDWVSVDLRVNSSSIQSFTLRSQGQGWVVVRQTTGRG
jgi:hypothetical protein